MPVVNVLQCWIPNGPSGVRNRETKLVINKRTGLPIEWKSTEDKIKTLPQKGKISLRRGMQQHLMIIILVLKGRLEVVGKDIPWNIAQMIELKRKGADPQVQISFIVTQSRFGWLDSQRKTKYGELRDRLGPRPL